MVVAVGGLLVAGGKSVARSCGRRTRKAWVYLRPPLSRASHHPGANPSSTRRFSYRGDPRAAVLVLLHLSHQNNHRLRPPIHLTQLRQRRTRAKTNFSLCRLPSSCAKNHMSRARIVLVYKLWWYPLASAVTRDKRVTWMFVSAWYDTLPVSPAFSL